MKIISNVYIYLSFHFFHLYVGTSNCCLATTDIVESSSLSDGKVNSYNRKKLLFFSLKPNYKIITFDICNIIFITNFLIPGRLILMSPVSQKPDSSKADNCALKNKMKCSSSLQDGFVALK